MDIPWRAALLVVVAAFVVFLIAKLLPARARRAEAPQALKTAKARLRDARSARERAETLCDAASASLAGPFGATRAAAYFLRAMRADPTWPGAVERAAAALLPRRAGLVRKMMWRRLAAMPWDAAHGAAVRAVVSTIVTASRGARRSSHLDVIERVLAGETLSAPKGG